MREERATYGKAVKPGSRKAGVVWHTQGSGKSITALAIMGLVPPPGRVEGSIRFADRELIGQSQAAWRALRGEDIAMVFQEPMTALNPVMTVMILCFESGWA